MIKYCTRIERCLASGQSLRGLTLPDMVSIAVFYGNRDINAQIEKLILPVPPRTGHAGPLHFHTEMRKSGQLLCIEYKARIQRQKWATLTSADVAGSGKNAANIKA